MSEPPTKPSNKLTMTKMVTTKKIRCVHSNAVSNAQTYSMYSISETL